MTPRRRLLSATCAALSLAGLAACEKPLPIVTLVSGTTSVYTEASTFCHDDQSPAAGDCSRGVQQPTVLRVRGGDTVAVDVAKVLADRTWLVALSDPQAAQGGQTTEEKSPVQDDDNGHDHYFSFTAPSLPETGSVLVTVRALGGPGDAATGEWRFLLQPGD